MALIIAIQQLLLFFVLLTSTSKYFPEIDGWDKDGEIEIYDPDNLYDYINGAADSYLAYDFEALYLQRYKGAKELSLKIEIYKLSNNLTAFGIYSAERPSNGNWVDIGSQGYMEKEILNFYKGQYYVKIMINRTKETNELLLAIGKSIEERIKGENTLIEAYSLFPEEGRIKYSERYINKNFLGYESLGEAYSISYEIEDNYFDLFLIEKPSTEDCKNMLVDYFESIKIDTALVKDGNIVVKDPYQGNFEIIWKNNIVAGTINYSDADLANNYLASFIQNVLEN